MTAFPVVAFPKTLRYNADSIKLNSTSVADILKTGFTAAAAVSLAERAAAAVAIEIVSLVKCAAMESQMVRLKLWLSPK